MGRGVGPAAGPRPVLRGCGRHESGSGLKKPSPDLVGVIFETGGFVGTPDVSESRVGLTTRNPPSTSGTKRVRDPSLRLCLFGKVTGTLLLGKWYTPCLILVPVTRRQSRPEAGVGTRVGVPLGEVTSLVPQVVVEGVVVVCTPTPCPGGGGGGAPTSEKGALLPFSVARVSGLVSPARVRRPSRFCALVFRLLRKSHASL